MMYALRANDVLHLRCKVIYALSPADAGALPEGEPVMLCLWHSDVKA